jgi:hypothetical protein
MGFMFFLFAVLVVFLVVIGFVADRAMTNTCESCGIRFRTGLWTSAWCYPCRDRMGGF